MAKRNETSLAVINGTVGYLDRGGIGYRKVRATSVLAANSHHFLSQETGPLMKVFSKLEKNNYDMERLSARDLEHLYAELDEDTTAQICSEYRFYPDFGNIRDLGNCVGHCRLCGKGDSRDDGGNQDKLRYEFLLTNTAGGQSVWVGSSCILHHGLHVDGAANAEQARAILQKTLSEHIRIWKIEAWKDANPDHETIPELWEKVRREPYFRSYPDAFFQAYGISDAYAGIRRWRELFRPFRSASRFYERKGFLTESKTSTWRATQKLWREWDLMFSDFREAMNNHVDQRSPYYQRDYRAALDFISEKKEARARELAAARSKPRRVAARLKTGS